MQERCNRLVIATGLLFLTMIVEPTGSSAGVPTDQIKATVDRALGVLKDPRLKPAAKTKERREQLKQILLTRFDFPEMAKRALGANWRRLKPRDQDEFIRLFTDLLEQAYADTIETYTDEKIVYVGEKLDGRFAEINSKIVTSGGQEFTIAYKAQLIGSEWRVYDVVVENISMVNNFRSQFNRVIAKDSYEELVRRLRDRSEVETRKN